MNEAPTAIALTLPIVNEEIVGMVIGELTVTNSDSLNVASRNNALTVSNPHLGHC